MNKIENEQIVDLSNITVEVRKLTCAICYCVLINPKRCTNRKCSKTFCGECIKSAISNELCCPFCRLTLDEVDFFNCDFNLSFVLNNMKVICNQIQCAGKVFKLENYFKHLLISKLKEDQCSKCFSLTGIKKNMKKCFNSLCSIISCSDCNLLKICIDCKINFCEMCLTKELHKETCKNAFLYNVDAEINCSCCDMKLNKENSEICEICQQTFCLNFPCEKYIDLQVNCKNCKDIKLTVCSEIKNCLHKKQIECDDCIPKCCFRNVIGHIKCFSCSKFSCSSAFCSSICKNCSEIFCKDCSVICKLCKLETCKTCCIKCDNCNFSYDNSYCCLRCAKTIGFSLIKRCSFIYSDKKYINQEKVKENLIDIINIFPKESNTKCETKLCLNCWNVCNACSIVQCSTHITKCLGCEESCCNLHLFHCDYCDNPEKMCLKNCTRKCDTCISLSALTCNKELHTQVEMFKCGHLICTKCTRKCSRCSEFKIKSNFLCNLCSNNKLSYCKYCKTDYCGDCNKYCGYCNEFYCPLHICANCSETVDKCLNCLIYDSQVYCEDCQEDFDICNPCSDILLCSLNCYKQYSTKAKHLCKMFSCDKCLNTNKEQQIDFLNNFGEGLCLDESSDRDINQIRFIEIEEVFGAVSDRVRRNLINITYHRPKRKNEKNIDDKVSTGCQDSCACIVF